MDKGFADGGSLRTRFPLGIELQDLTCPSSARPGINHCFAVYFGPWPQHFLYFFPLPQGQGSFRPTFDPVGRAGTDAGIDREGVCVALEPCNDEDSFHRPQYEMT